MGRYAKLIEAVFHAHYQDGVESFQWQREELEEQATHLQIKLPKNVGDVVYSIRYRQPLPESIQRTAPEGKEWVIHGAGKGAYLFTLVSTFRITPNRDLIGVKIPDATPELVRAYQLSDEQALLAMLRYNRLVDVFLGITCYSLQNHLRTTVRGIGQVEVDELYVGVDGGGRQFIVPVQAKGGADELATVQSLQDIRLCEEKFPNLICRAISAQFMDERHIALFELGLQEGEVGIVREVHYLLVPHAQINSGDLRAYGRRLTT